MNNDISGEFQKHIATNTKYAKVKASEKKSIQNETQTKDYGKTQNYLSMLGRIKVQMDKTGVDNRVADAVEMFKRDPEYVQSHLEFCDALQERGYGLEDAIIGTDIIFKGLKQESIYRP